MPKDGYSIKYITGRKLNCNKAVKLNNSIDTRHDSLNTEFKEKTKNRTQFVANNKINYLKDSDMK